MKTTELIKKVMELGFTREDALEGIDTSIEDFYEENFKKGLAEDIDDELANDILFSFKIEKEEDALLEEDKKEKWVEYERNCKEMAECEEKKRKAQEKELEEYAKTCEEELNKEYQELAKKFEEELKKEDWYR